MPSASFRFGAHGEHEAIVECGYFGSEKYFVDGVPVFNHWSLAPGGVRRFNAHGHAIEVRMTINLRQVSAQALVDGQVVANDLFADFNAGVARRGLGARWFVRVAVWFVVALVAFTVFKPG